MIVGTVALVATSSPIMLLYESQPLFSLLISAVMFSVISVVAYRYSLKGAKTVMAEMIS